MRGTVSKSGFDVMLETCTVLKQCNRYCENLSDTISPVGDPSHSCCVKPLGGLRGLFFGLGGSATCDSVLDLSAAICWLCSFIRDSRAAILAGPLSLSMSSAFLLLSFPFKISEAI